MHSQELNDLIAIIARLPGLGPRSGKRLVLHLLKNRHSTMANLIRALQDVSASLTTCTTCGNIDTSDPCHICSNARRDASLVCVVESVGDLWAIERSSTYRGVYHVLGGALSASRGLTPQDLTIQALMNRLLTGEVHEVILALNATSEGLITTHYLIDLLRHAPVKVSELAHGVPVGGELDYLDDGTLVAALAARRAIEHL